MATGARNDFRSPPRDRWGVPGVQYPTPNIEDYIVVEDVPVNAQNSAPLVRGTPHSKKPHALLIAESVSRGDNSEAVWKRIYATPRAAQDAYNGACKFVAEGSDYPIWIRSYILPRPVVRGTRNAPLSSLIGLTLGDAGTGFYNRPIVTFTGGGGTGATAEGSIDGHGHITALWLTDGGSGYTSAPVITLTCLPNNAAVAATAVAHLAGTSIASISISNGGSYDLPPVVSFVGGGGAGAAATAVLTLGGITSVNITNAGTGYTSEPTVVFTNAPGSAFGSGGTAEALLTPAAIASISVLTGGSGYTSVPTVTIGGGGTGATATATVVAGVVTAIAVTAGGSGYNVSGLATGVPVTLSGSGGVGSTATALLQEQSAVLTHEEIAPVEGDLGSLFDRVLRVYSTQSGPVVHDRTSGIKGFLIDRTEQAVAPGTLPGAATGTTLRDEVRQTSTTEAVRITEKLVDGSGNVASGFPAQTTSADDKETGVTIFTDHFTAGPNYALPPRYVGGTQALIAANYSDWKWPRTAGSIGSVTITNGGSGYTSAPTVNLSGGGGSGAAAVATLTGGVVTGIGFTSLGTGYATAPSVSFTGGGGSGAAATVTIASDSVGLSTVSYSPKRYVIDARSSPVGEDSDNLVINIEYCRVPTYMVEDKPIGFVFPAVFAFNPTPYTIPNDYGGQYRPPWPIGLDQLGGYELLDHRAASWPARHVVTYSLGRREALPPEYGVESPGTASKIFRGLISQNTIHPPISITETLSDDTVQPIEDIPSSTPATYSPFDILVARASEERWAGEIYRQTVVLTSEKRLLSAFPDITTNGFYRGQKPFQATPGVVLDGKSNGKRVFAKTSSGSESVSLRVIGRAQLGDPPVSTAETMAVTSTGVASTNTFVTVREALLVDPTTERQAPASIVDVLLYEAVDPDTGSLTVTGTPADGDLLRVGTPGSERLYRLRNSFSSDGVTSLTLTNGGGNYGVTPTVTISGDGTGATAEAVMSGGMVASLRLLSPGTGYTAATVAFGGIGTGATATAVMGVQLGTFAVTGSDSGYTGGETVVISGGGGSGATGILGTIMGGVLQDIVITNGGSGYTSRPTVTTTGGTGTGATTLVPLSLVSVTVTNGGSDYNSGAPPTVGFSGGSPTADATAAATVTTGAVSSIAVTSGGSGYTSAPTVVISAGGGAAATATVSGADQIKISSTKRYTAGHIAGAIRGDGVGSYVSTGTVAHAQLTAERNPSSLATVDFSSLDPTSNTSDWAFIVTEADGVTPASWATLEGFFSGTAGQLLCTIPAGTPYAYGSADFSSNLCLVDAASDNDRKAVPSVPAATVFYTDWLAIPDGKEIMLVYGCSSVVRMAYQKSSTASEPAPLAASIGCTLSSKTISFVSGTNPSGYAGCKIVIAGDTCENEIVSGTTLLRAYRGATGTRSASITPLAANLIAQAAPGKVRSVSIGVPGTAYIRLKLTQNNGALRYRAMRAYATWSIGPDD